MTVGIDSQLVEQAVAAAPFQISRRRWRRLLDELERRGGGRRESGAFLLAAADGSRVQTLAYYDDLDADCLTGGISFASAGFTTLWQICADRGLRVVADIHTHPGPWVGQSAVDATNPMISIRGHVAIIAPEYGRPARVDECGVHIYLGSHRWVRVAEQDIEGTVTMYGLFSRHKAAAIRDAARTVVQKLRHRRAR